VREFAPARQFDRCVASPKMTKLIAPPQPYTDNFDVLVAVLTHLANTDAESRTVTNMARDLGFEEQQVRTVVQNFTGIFRKSRPDHEGKTFYTVHMRYARRKREGERVPTEPLTAEELASLFDLVSNMVARENEMSKLHVELTQRNRTLLWTNIVTMVAALLAALIAILTALMKH
jgi:hypothetical protein